MKLKPWICFISLLIVLIPINMNARSKKIKLLYIQAGVGLGYTSYNEKIVKDKGYDVSSKEPVIYPNYYEFYLGISLTNNILLNFGFSLASLKTLKVLDSNQPEKEFSGGPPGGLEVNIRYFPEQITKGPYLEAGIGGLADFFIKIGAGFSFSTNAFGYNRGILLGFKIIFANGNVTSTNLAHSNKSLSSWSAISSNICLSILF